MEQKLYPVFEVDICFQEYAMDERLIGAESVEDLKEKLPEMKKELGLKVSQIKKIIKDAEWRIRPIEHLYTDEPYKSLNCSCYME